MSSPALPVRPLPLADSGVRRYCGLGAGALLHLAALVVLFRTEESLAAGLILLLTWALLNFAFLTVLRRPAAAAAVSLVVIVVLILLSRFKQDILIMSANFIDVLLIDSD